MSVAIAPANTVGLHLPWVNMTLDYTEKLVALIPDELLDWRPADPNGHFQFSLAEIAMHLADTRRMFARQLSGSESDEGYWTIWDESEGQSTEMVWRFKPRGSRDEILASLRAAREELNEWLNRDAGELQNSTPGTQAVFDKNLAKMQEKGDDVSAMHLRGAATLNRIMFAVACHEAGHRGSLQTLLRMNGVDARGEH